MSGLRRRQYRYNISPNGCGNLPIETGRRPFDSDSDSTSIGHRTSANSACDNEGSVVPRNPKIYHITHLENLPQIVDSVIWSDADRLRRRLSCTIVGMSEIKRRRLEELEVGCHPGSKVGEYVPFYFCPRSIMLYLLHRGNHPDVTYRARWATSDAAFGSGPECRCGLGGFLRA